MCFIFKENNKQTRKPVNRVLQDDASASIRSLQTSTEIKLLKYMERTLVSLMLILFDCLSHCLLTLKPGLHISRKDRKHLFANMFFKLS